MLMVVEVGGEWCLEVAAAVGPVLVAPIEVSSPG